MTAARRFRTTLLLIAGGLAGCQAPLPRSLEVIAGEPTRIALQMKSGMVLSLRNESSGRARETYSIRDDQQNRDDRQRNDDRQLKVVPDAEMQTLLDLFTAQKLFDLSVPNVPPRARDVVRLDHRDRTYIWARRGSYTDPREAAFQQVYGYFMTLYNGNEAYYTDTRRDFRTHEEETRRKAQRAKDHLNNEATRGQGGGQR